MRVKVSRFLFNDGELRARGHDLIDWVWPGAISAEVSAHMQGEIRRAGMLITAEKWRRCTLFRDEIERDFR